MGLFTTFFNLIKPTKTDGVKVSDFNANMDVIDTEMHRPPLSVNGVFPDSTTRNLYLEEVPLASNLSSDIAQLNTGTYIERTSGGDASIEDGYAALVSISGNMVHTGYVPESIEWTLTATGEEPITATFDRDTFVSYVQSSGTITLTYTTAWSATPALYGFTITGTPVDGDEIEVVYVKEVRGTITPATPTTFNSTGWNLYNNDTGIARVVHYSDEYGYYLGGNYSLVQFSETLTGTKTTVTVTSGNFNVPANGYIFITGGDATTYIYPTWSDWGSGYEGNFQTYTVDTVDLTEAMLNFPNGMFAIGNVRDEINLNAQRAINRIERLAYTAENLATVIASGVAYEYDENYIYAVMETPSSNAISVDGSYTVSDHGIEFFTGTTIPVITETLYGENLKDKLRTDVLTISAQELTAAQKAQVRTNLDVPSNGNFVMVSVDMSGTMSQKFQAAFTTINGRGYATDKSYPVMMYISGANFNGIFTGTFNMSSGGIRFLVGDETRIINGLFARATNTISSISDVYSKLKGLQIEEITVPQTGTYTISRNNGTSRGIMTNYSGDASRMGLWIIYITATSEVFTEIKSSSVLSLSSDNGLKITNSNVEATVRVLWFNRA